ncbi:MAG: hypothetical protein MZV64_23180 [Ignavibacteriales bacterium]|nr:hypothetical protein [Ignavibacteriales bacterium]
MRGGTAGDSFTPACARRARGTSFKSVGYLSLNEIVCEIEANADRSWLGKIRRAGRLRPGHVSEIPGPCPFAPAGRRDETSNTGSRQAGFTCAKDPARIMLTVGYVSQSEVVVALGANADQSHADPPP